MRFLDRQEEMRRLMRLHAEGRGGFVALWGRRRIGKSELLKEWCKATGGLYAVADRSLPAVQRQDYAQVVESRFAGFAAVTYPTWKSLFEELGRRAAADGWHGPVAFMASRRSVFDSAPASVRKSVWRAQSNALFAEAWGDLARGFVVRSPQLAALAGENDYWRPAGRWWQGSAHELDVVSVSGPEARRVGDSWSSSSRRYAIAFGDLPSEARCASEAHFVRPSHSARCSAVPPAPHATLFSVRQSFRFAWVSQIFAKRRRKPPVARRSRQSHGRSAGIACRLGACACGGVFCRGECLVTLDWLTCGDRCDPRRDGSGELSGRRARMQTTVAQ